MTRHHLKNDIDHYLERDRSLLLVRRTKLPYANCEDCRGKSDAKHRAKCPCLRSGGMCHGFYAGSKDPDVIDGWLNKKKTAVGLAQATGKPSGVFTVDVDEGGVEGLEELIRAHGGDWPDTETHLSHRGLPHYIFQMPTDGMDVHTHLSKLAPKNDIKGTGGYSILPPSRGSKGVYARTNNLPPVQAPAWLLDLIRGWEADRIRPVSSEFRRYDPEDIPAEINRMARRMIDRWAMWIIDSPDGQQNKRIYMASWKMFSLVEAGVLNPADADSILMDAAADGNHPASRAIYTIDSGSFKAASEPFSVRDLLGPTQQERADEYLQSALPFFNPDQESKK